MRLTLRSWRLPHRSAWESAWRRSGRLRCATGLPRMTCFAITGGRWRARRRGRRFGRRSAAPCASLSHRRRVMTEIGPEARQMIVAFIDIAIDRVARMTAYAPFEPAIAQALLNAQRAELFDRIVAERN